MGPFTLTAIPLIIIAIAIGCALRYIGFGTDAKNMRLWKSVGPVVAIAILGSIIGYTIGMSRLHQKEFINYRLLSIEHQEEWTTHETRTETYYTGSGKNRTSHTRTVHYTQRHGPYFTGRDEMGEKYNIGQDNYIRWRMVWPNERKTGHHKGSASGFDRAISGDIFECNWPHTFETVYPGFSIGSYENRIRASSNTAFHFKEPTKELVAKYPRPADQGNPNPIINYGSAYSPTPNDQLVLMRANASLGCGSQVHCLFMMFDATTSTPSIVDDVLSAWQGVNKNELVSFMGIDPTTKKVSWVKVESWQDNTKIHGTLSDAFLGKEFKASEVSATLMSIVPREWKRKRFRDFGYIKVSLSTGGEVFSVISWLIAIVYGSIAIWLFSQAKDDYGWSSYGRSTRGMGYRNFRGRW
jgi:hypothetical protein